MIKHVFLTIAIVLLSSPGTPHLFAQSALDWGPAEWDQLENLPVVTVGTDATWPPMEYFNRDGELVGFDIDLVREIGRRAGFRPVFRPVAWDGIFIGLINRSYDMIASSVTILEERKHAMLFSDPYLEAAQYVVVPRQDTAVQQLSDLSGREVGAQIGTTGARIAGAAGASVRTYDDLGLAIEDMVQGRLAGVVADVAIIEYYVLAHPEYGSELRVVDHPYALEMYGFAVRRDLPDLRDRINEALAELHDEGTLMEIKRFWFRHITPGSPGSPAPSP